MQDELILERAGDGSPILLIRFNRPDKKNAITRTIYARMTQALQAANEDRDVRAIVFLGSPGCFCAGNDIGDFVAAAERAEIPLEIPEFLHALVDLRKPVLSGVDGLAIGIGATLHLHCDLTVASPRSLFRTPFVDLGLVPEAASSLIAPRLMGHQRAFRFLVLGEDLTGEDAFSLGLVSHLAPPEAVEDSVLGLARRLCDKPAEALAAARALLRGDAAQRHARIDEEARLFSERLRSPEAHAAFAAFFRRGSSSAE